MSLRYNIKNTNTKTSIYFRPSETSHLDDIKLLLENHDKIDIYPNSEDVNPYNSYQNVTDYIYRIISTSEFLCKGLNPDYILESFNKVDAVIVIGSSSMNILPNGNIFGFALINFDEKKNSIYIDVICSHIGIKGAGDILINEIEYISRKLFMAKIYLKSVKSAISFYEKYGFIKYDQLCDTMCVMIKTINKKIGGKKRKTIKRKIHLLRKGGAKNSVVGVTRKKRYGSKKNK